MNDENQWYEKMNERCARMEALVDNLEKQVENRQERLKIYDGVITKMARLADDNLETIKDLRKLNQGLVAKGLEQSRTIKSLEEENRLLREELGYKG